MTLLSITLVLFLIMDPVGSIGPYLKLVQGIPPKRHRIIIVREMLIALGLMVAFSFFGEAIFHLLDISDTTVRLSSGIILFLFAIKIIFPSRGNPRERFPKEEPFIIPLATPFIAGPALLATIMLFAHMEPSQITMLTAVFIAWAAGFIVLFFAPQLHKLLGDNGLMACERLMAMVLVLLAIQRFMEGIRQFFIEYGHIS